MARKPVPGGDEGQWGEVLNSFLDVVHDSTGSLKAGSVTENSLSQGVADKINVIAGQQGPAGPTGPAGETGPAGADGADGVGVPVGGTTGQVLSKASAVDYDTQWVAQSGSGSTSWNDLTDVPTSFAPSTHGHSISQVTNLQDGLDGKEDAGAVAAHEAEADPHATAGYAMMLGGGRRIFVQATDPGTAASDGDLWIDTAA